MSGIAGLWQLNQHTADRAELERMSRILSHRGSDAEGCWADGAVGLVHRMLWTTPESLHETLPYNDENAHLVITADARIDNRRDLLKPLGLANDVPDSQIILAAYLKWGEQCPEKFIGDFAFAIWDIKQHKLFCARDHFGVKPFYYCYKPGQLFAFASEMKALVLLPGVSSEMSETAIGDYLSMTFEDTSITFYEDVLRLPPAHSLTVSQNGIRLTHYWQLDPTYELHLGSDAEYAEQYRELFTEAVRCRMRSAYPVGTALSGGLDSSSIACVARDFLRENGSKLLPTFSFVFDDVPESDERPFINTVLEQGGFEPHYVPGDQISPFADFERLAWHHDSVPFFAPQLFLHLGLWGKAQQEGVRIFLDGLIGDNTTSQGSGYLLELARHWHWVKLAQELRGAAPILPQVSVAKHWLAYVKQEGIKPYIPASVMNTYRKLRGRSAPRWNWKPDQVIQPDFAERIHLEQRVKKLTPDRTFRSERWVHYQYLTMGLIPLAFEVTDKTTAMFNIEARYPFADRRLAAFCLSLPAHLKFHNGYGRMIARNGLASILPDKIRWRYTKGNLAPNFKRSLMMYDRERLEQVVHDPIPSVMKYLDVTGVAKSYDLHMQPNSKNDPYPFWAAVMFDQVLRYRGTSGSVEQRKEVVTANT